MTRRFLDSYGNYYTESYYFYEPEYDPVDDFQRARGTDYGGRARPPSGGGAMVRPPQQGPPRPQQRPPQQRPPMQQQRPPIQQRPPVQQRPPIQQRPPQAPRPTQKPVQWRPPPKSTRPRTTTKKITTTTKAPAPEPVVENVAEIEPEQPVEEVSEEVAVFNADGEGPGGEGDRKKYQGGNKPGGGKYPNNGGGNNNGGGGGSGFGDPHFVVQTPGQDQLCFDFNPVEGTDMNILIDPESSLSISATSEERHSGKTFMNSVHFASPNGAHLEFDIEGVHLAGLGDGVMPTDKHPLTGHQQYGDILFVEHW